MTGQGSFGAATVTPAQARNLPPGTPYYLAGDPTLHYAVKRVVPLHAIPLNPAAIPQPSAPFIPLNLTPNQPVLTPAEQGAAAAVSQASQIAATNAANAAAAQAASPSAPPSAADQGAAAAVSQASQIAAANAAASAAQQAASPGPAPGTLAPATSSPPVNLVRVTAPSPGGGGGLDTGSMALIVLAVIGGLVLWGEQTLSKHGA